MKKLILIFIFTLYSSVAFTAEYQEQRNDDNVLTGYVRTFDNAHIPLVFDNTDYKKVLAWIMAGNTPDPYPFILDKAKQKKVKEYKNEGLRRIALSVPEWKSFEIIDIIASIWSQLSNKMQSQIDAKNIYVYVKSTAIPNVNAQTNIASVQAMDVTNDPDWP